MSSHHKKIHACIAGCGSLVGKINTRCWNCYSLKRSPPPVAAPVPEGSYSCLGNCHTSTNQPNTWCLTCRRQRQFVIAQSAEKKTKLKRAQQSFEKGSTLGIMYVGEEAFSLSAKCQRPSCAKPLIITSLCYQCATGRPITLKIRPLVILRSDVPQLDQASL